MAQTIASIDRRYNVMASDVHEQATQLRKQQEKIKQLELQLSRVTDDLDQAENRSQRNHL